MVVTQGFLTLQGRKERKENNQPPMQLTINGEAVNFSAGNTVGQLLEQLQLSDRPVAVERNGQIVSHSIFDQTELTEGDVLEVVTLVGGG